MASWSKDWFFLGVVLGLIFGVFFWVQVVAELSADGVQLEMISVAAALKEI